MKRHPEGGYLVKLVRDGIADALGGDGTVTYRTMPRDEHVRRLRQKLVEEAMEYALDPSLAELSHVLLALRALANVDLGTTWDRVEEQAGREVDERGGFSFGGVGMYVLHSWDRGGER